MADTSFPTPDPSPSGLPTAREPIRPYPNRSDAPPAAALPGYEFLRELGRGGMGVVYLVRNRVLDRLEAVKVLFRPWSEDRFRQEVRAAARLRHPNVVTVYAALTAESCLAFAMEYVDGATLSRVVRTRGPLSPALACEYVRQAALGLQHAHERGITHRDVKSQNLMLCRVEGRDTVKILDFGLVKVGADTCDAEPVTADGQILGTPGYAAPEQMQDASTADVRSDVYGLGVTLRFLLTGDHPGGVRPPACDPGSGGRGWPEGLGAVLVRMTAHDPAERYQTPAEVASVLAPFAAVPAPVADAIIPLEGGNRPRRVVWARASGVAAAALAATALAWPTTPSDSPPTGGEAPIVPAAPHRPEPKFVPLFNGTDLSGWVVDGGTFDQWRVEDGTLVTTGTRNGPKTWLLSDRDFGDVRVRFEYQLEPGGNSGFVFRAVPGERPVLRAGGPPTATPYHQQVELSDDAHRDWHWLPTGQINGGSGKDAPALKPVRPACLRFPPEWNAVEFGLVGQSLTVSLNGEMIQTADLNQLVAQGSRYPALTRAHGRIGFQQLAKTARFRNVEVMELADTR
ncbi:MAG: DUF1080 domain-containing protein [Planctomycetes bacterium]|nr:DUF1080 domain-containing protein [Planctomycetota bacterium]